MGLILGIAGGIAALAIAAIKFFDHLHQQEVAEPIARGVKQSTGVVISIAKGLRLLLEALLVFAPRRSYAATGGGGSNFRIGTRLNELDDDDDDDDD